MAAELFIPPSKALDANANPYAGAKWFFYATGTTTPQSVYTTFSMGTTHANPVVADSTGKFANIFFDPALVYRGVLKNADESVTLHDIDPISSSTLASLAASGGSALVGFSFDETYPDETVGKKLKDLGISVTDAPYNAVGDGVANDTAAILAAIADLSSGAKITFPPLTYKINQIVFDGLSNVGVFAYGATFNLDGNNAGFVVKGSSLLFKVYGGTIIGDGVNRDGALGTIQIGWSFGNEPGANVQFASIQDVYVEGANQGFRFARGTGVGSGVTGNVTVTNCHAKDIVGVVGGSGYGFMFSQAPDSSIKGSTADNCERHGIYFAEGRNYTASSCIIKNHRSAVSIGAYRVAMSISRSRNTTVNGVVFDNCHDGSVGIDVDAGGTSPDNVSIGTVVSGCIFLNSTLADIHIGTSNPETDGIPYDVVVTGCIMIRLAGSNVPSLLVEAGERIKIEGNMINAALAGSSIRAINLSATGGATYTDDVEITGNTIFSAGYGVQVESAICTGSNSVRILRNVITSVDTELNFIGGENSITNNNLIYNRTNGVNAARSYTSSGTNVIIPVGGLDVITLEPSSATTVANFSGGTVGQKLTVYFANGNATLTNANFYLAAAGSFAGTSSDTLSLVYMGGFWREVCRSIN